jgi:hypothetical protein
MIETKCFDIEDMRYAVRHYYLEHSEDLRGFWGDGDEDPDKIYDWVVNEVDSMTDAEVAEEYVNTIIAKDADYDEPLAEIPLFAGTKQQLEDL